MHLRLYISLSVSGLAGLDGQAEIRQDAAYPQARLDPGALGPVAPTQPQIRLDHPIVQIRFQQLLLDVQIGKELIPAPSLVGLAETTCSHTDVPCSPACERTSQ